MATSRSNMYLKNIKGQILLKYTTDGTGGKIDSISEVNTPNDYKLITEWLQYNRDIETALNETGLIIY